MSPSLPAPGAVARHRESVQVEPCGAIPERPPATSAHTFGVEAFEIGNESSEANQDLGSLRAGRCGTVDQRRSSP